MRLLMLIAPSVLVSIVLWAAFVACIDSPPAEGTRTARIVARWDPLACGTPHRVAIELADEEGSPISSSAPCTAGGLELEAPHHGVYQGRVYAWTAGQPIRSIMPARLVVDEAVVRWVVATPE